MSYANAPIVLNSRDRTGQSSYNNATFNAENQNIIQGNIKEIAVSEVNFPYDIPNIQNGYNVFKLVNGGGVYEFTITVPAGFYNGVELVAAVNGLITSEGAAATPPLIPAEMPTLNYDDISNRFYFAAPTTDVGPPGNVWLIESPYTFPPAGQQSNNLGKDILSIMGYLPFQNGDNVVDADVGQGRLLFFSNSAPLVFTQYIDMCSSQLCGKQRFSDGSTTNLARRSNVICRLYISDNIAITTADPEGVRPFIINRQYFNARVMRWTNDASIGTIDIQLYDDCGQPLATSWAPRNYQITFNCYERTVMDEAKEAKASAVGGGISAYPTYHEKNTTVAWAQLANQNPGKRR